MAATLTLWSRSACWCRLIQDLVSPDPPLIQTWAPPLWPVLNLQTLINVWSFINTGCKSVSLRTSHVSLVWFWPDHLGIIWCLLTFCWLTELLSHILIFILLLDLPNCIFSSEMMIFKDTETAEMFPQLWLFLCSFQVAEKVEVVHKVVRLETKAFCTCWTERPKLFDVSLCDKWKPWSWKTVKGKTKGSSCSWVFTS